MNLYLAAPWKYRDEARTARDILQHAGYLVIARWLDFVGDTTDPRTLHDGALKDWTDLSRCDLVVVLNLEKSEGKAVEQGLALAWGIPILGVGIPSNVFHYLPYYTWVPTLKDAIDYLAHRPLPGPDGHP